VQLLIISLGFISTGIIVGYFSPGRTVTEAAIAGGILMVLTIGGIYFDFIKADSIGNVALFSLIIGMPLTQLGGWVGEELQEGTDTTRKLQWRWIVVAVIFGYVLNNFSVFFVVSYPDFRFSTLRIFFAISFLVTGFVIGYRSPGVTIIEPAIAGFVILIFNYLFAKLGLDIDFLAELDMMDLIWIIVGAPVLALIGGWVGEKVQASMEGTVEKK
jgi:hypothetical protein